MFELFVGLGESLFAIFFQIWLLGLVLCLLLCRRSLWTFTDAFFLGLLWNALIGLFIAPFSSDTFVISIAVKVASVLLLLGFSLSFLHNKRHYKDNFTRALGRSLSKNHILLAMGVTLIVMGFVVTHTLGFDDIAHLKYLNEAKTIEPYPVFRMLVGEWEAARYPFFGLLIGELGQHIVGSALFLYYTLGITIFIAFILKVYEFLLVGNLQKFVALATVLLVAAVLMIGGADNYFNYGLYPLQQSKLLFIVGFLYILIGWGLQRNQSYFFIGSGLLIFAVLYHLNLLLLYAVIAPLIILYIFIRRSSRKQWRVFSLSFILLPLLAVPAALSPENGFLRYEEPPVEVSTGGGTPSVKKEKPSQFALLLIKAKKMLSWIKNGRYKTRYFQRIFSLDIILIPLILILALQVGLLINFSFLAVIIALIIFVQQMITVIPKQFMASMFHSGTFWVLADISRSGIGFSQYSGRTLTDPYTEIILKILGIKNIQHLNDQQNLLSFSPQFSTAGRQYTASQLELSKADRFLFNGRYWGVKAVDRWQGVDEGSLSHFSKNLDDFYERGNIQRLKSMARRGLDYAKMQINMPMLTSAAQLQDGDAYQDLLDVLPKDPVSIYRNAALVNISNLAIGDKVRLKFEGKGDPDYLGFLSRNRNLKALNITGKKKVFTFDVVDNIPHIVLLFEMDLGHVGGLGAMESVSISINE